MGVTRSLILFAGLGVTGQAQDGVAVQPRTTPTAPTNKFVISEGPTIATLLKDNARENRSTRWVALGMSDEDRKALQKELRKCRLLILDETKTVDGKTSPVGKPRVTLSGHAVGVLPGGAIAYVVRIQPKSLISLNQPGGRDVDLGVDLELRSNSGRVTELEGIPVTAATVGLSAEFSYTWKPTRNPQTKTVVLPAWADVQKREPVEWPEAFHGHVRNEAKEPIANAKVTVLLQVQLFPPGGGIVEKDVYRQEVTTDESGNWSLPTDKVPTIVHRPYTIVVKASAPNLVPWSTWVWHGMPDKKAWAKRHTITLPEGYKLSGVCVDGDGNPAKGARFRVSHANMGGRGRWALRDYRCNERGEFSLLVPKAGQKAFWIYGDTLAPMFKLAPDAEKQDLKYELKSGARAIGFVRDEAGKPADNVVVLATSSFSGTVPQYSLSFQFATRTDGKGRFRLPPLEGEYQFQLTSAGKLLDGSFFEAAKPAPTMIPVKRTLESRKQGLILRPSKSAVVSGIARWPDKSPAADVIVSAFARPDGKGRSVQIGKTATDKNGRYSIRVPVPLQYFTVWSISSAYFKGKRVTIRAKSDSKAFTFDRMSAIAKPLESDAQVDFEYVEEKPR